MTNSTYKTALSGAALALMLIGVAACSDDATGSASAGTTASAGAATSSAAASTSAGGPTANAAAAPTKAPLKLGWIGTVSGPAAPTGQQTQGAVKAWEESVNARGGINGHPVKVSYEDDAGDPARGLAAVKKLVEEVGVIALVGNHANTTETAFADYITQHKVPVVGGESDTPVWLQNPYFFVSGEPGVATLDTEAFVTKSVGKTNFGSVNEGNVQDVGPLITLLEQATQKYGLKYAYHTTAQSSEPNYTAKCLAAQQAGAEVIALNLAPNTRQRVVSDCSRQNLKVNYLIPSGAFTPDALKDPVYEGTFVPTNNFLWFADTPVATEFRDAMKQYSPSVVLGPSATQGWSGGKLFEAAAKSLPDNPTSADVLAGLYALAPNDTLNGVSVGATFKAGQPADTRNCFFLAQIKGGALTVPQGNDPICPPGE